MCNVSVCAELILGKRGTEICLSNGSSFRSVISNEASHTTKRSRHAILTDPPPPPPPPPHINVDKMHAFIHKSREKLYDFTFSVILNTIEDCPFKIQMKVNFSLGL